MVLIEVAVVLAIPTMIGCSMCAYGMLVMSCTTRCEGVQPEFVEMPPVEMVTQI
jgi:hypothetical protein